MILSTAALCLALNVYYESRNQTIEGQHAVAQVTMNRAKHDHRNVCGVVFKPKQFSWANPLTATSGKERRKIAMKFLPNDSKAWVLAKSIATLTLMGQVPDFSKGATFYHTKGVSPGWRHDYKLVATIGQHKFYRA